MADQTYAVINSSGLVENIIVWDGVTDWTPPSGCTIVASETAEVGGTYSGGEFTAPLSTSSS